MTEQLPERGGNENEVTVRYWAAARAAAGVETETVDAATLAELLDEIDRRHRDRERFRDVVATCSILVGEVPVGAKDPAEVVLRRGDRIELLPPFAGGA